MGENIKITIKELDQALGGIPSWNPDLFGRLSKAEETGICPAYEKGCTYYKDAFGLPDEEKDAYRVIVCCSYPQACPKNIKNKMGEDPFCSMHNLKNRRPELNI